MSALRAEGGIKFRGNCSGNGSTIEKKMWSELLKQDWKVAQSHTICNDNNLIMSGLQTEGGKVEIVLRREIGCVLTFQQNIQQFEFFHCAK